MNIGTIKTDSLPEDEKKITKRSGLTGGGSSNSGKGDGSDGSDDHGNRNDLKDKTHEVPSQLPDKPKVITWFLLLIVLMTFGGLIGAYIVVSTNNAIEWRPFDLPLPVYFSTLIIIVSSITYHTAKLALDADDQVKAINWLLITSGLGALFIASQLVVWLTLVNAGAYMYGNPFAGFFYILTATHAAHVVGGILVLSWLLLRSWHPTRNPEELTYRKNVARSVGHYWHFMGVLWIALLFLLGLWK